MKAVFLDKEKQTVYSVYSISQREYLSAKFGVPERVYTAENLGELTDVEYIFSTWGMPSLTVEQIAKYLPRLKAVFYAAGSVQAFARPFLERGVRVFSAWQANAVPVAECAVSEILLSTKGFWYLSGRAKKDYAGAHEDMGKFCGNFGAKVGILGYGAIAKIVVRELKRHDIDVYVSAPDFTEADEKATGAVKSDMNYIFENCCVISNHIADNDRTKGIINAELIAKLKPYTTFINTARGAQVDETALIAKLKSDPSVTALLDVTYPEPPEKDSELYSLQNCILTPHVAGSSGQEVHRMAQYMIEEAERLLSGKELRYEVVAKMLDRMA